MSAQDRDEHKEPSWLQIDVNLPLGGFLNPVDEPSLPRARAANPLPTIDDAPPLFDPDRLREPRFAEAFVVAAEETESVPEEGLKVEINMEGEKPEAPEPVPPVIPEKPYKSKIAQELGVLPFEANQDDNHGLTYMLNDSLDEPPPVPVILDSDESLLDLREQQVRQRKQRKVEDRRRKKSDWPWILGSTLLALTAFALLAFLFRTEIGRNMPQARPYLEQACRELGCTVPYPREPEQIKVESSNLIAEAPQEGRSRLVVTLRNKAPYPVDWPSVELTLTDKFDIAIVRRVLTPAEWLPKDQAKLPAFAGHSEITANVLIESKSEPSGFRVYAFYP